jgi:hypothetical protein
LFTRIYKSWDDIKFIGVGHYPFRQEGRRSLVIYFTSDCDPEGTFASDKAFVTGQ